MLIVWLAMKWRPFKIPVDREWIRMIGIQPIQDTLQTGLLWVREFSLATRTRLLEWLAMLKLVMCADLPVHLPVVQELG